MAENVVPISTIDINNPPRVQYVHQEFPKMVYDHAKSSPARIDEKIVNNLKEEIHVPPYFASKIVKDEAELAEALEQGYSEAVPSFDSPKKGRK